MKNICSLQKLETFSNYLSHTTGSDGVSFRFPQLFFSQHRLKYFCKISFLRYLNVDRWWETEGNLRPESCFLWPQLPPRLSLIGRWVAARPRSANHRPPSLDNCGNYLQMTSCVRRTLCISGFLIWLLPSYSTTCLLAESISRT